MLFPRGGSGWGDGSKVTIVRLRNNHRTWSGLIAEQHCALHMPIFMPELLGF